MALSLLAQFFQYKQKMSFHIAYYIANTTDQGGIKHRVFRDEEEYTRWAAWTQNSTRFDIAHPDFAGKTKMLSFADEEEYTSWVGELADIRNRIAVINVMEEGAARAARYEDWVELVKAFMARWTTYLTPIDVVKNLPISGYPSSA